MLRVSRLSRSVLNNLSFLDFHWRESKKESSSKRMFKHGESKRDSVSVDSSLTVSGSTSERESEERGWNELIKWNVHGPTLRRRSLCIFLSTSGSFRLPSSFLSFFLSFFHPFVSHVFRAFVSAARTSSQLGAERFSRSFALSRVLAEFFPRLRDSSSLLIFGVPPFRETL